jgi:hypothetical protein
MVIRNYLLLKAEEKTPWYSNNPLSQLSPLGVPGIVVKRFAEATVYGHRGHVCVRL